MRLAHEDQIRFAEALINPPKQVDSISGKDRIDSDFRETVSQNVKREYATCFVAREVATDRVAGFYTLCHPATSL